MFLSVWMLSLSVFATVQAVQANNPLLSLQSLQKEVQQHCTTHCLALLHADEMCKPFCQFSQHVAEEHFLEIKEDLNRVRDGNKNELIEWAVKDVVASKVCCILFGAIKQVF